MGQLTDAVPAEAEAELEFDEEAEEFLADDESDALSPEEAPVRQVPAYIAIIRILAVLGMGLSISFGLFIMLVGVKGIIVGVPILLLSIPCYYGMQLAERLVARHEEAVAREQAS
ncbi:MAG: hypothetical protein IVW36_08035 [Dehalococcoidia bacterium]|nr:hypothetical protein [Dehalococcoidia bacterium]